MESFSRKRKIHGRKVLCFHSFFPIVETFILEIHFCGSESFQKKHKDQGQAQRTEEQS
jgi:hypothetical protein